MAPTAALELAASPAHSPSFRSRRSRTSFRRIATAVTAAIIYTLLVAYVVLGAVGYLESRAGQASGPLASPAPIAGVEGPLADGPRETVERPTQPAPGFDPR
jgi:hypothetical protein